MVIILREKISNKKWIQYEIDGQEWSTWTRIRRLTCKEWRKKQGISKGWEKQTQRRDVLGTWEQEQPSQWAILLNILKYSNSSSELFYQQRLLAPKGKNRNWT